jgi:hypothetical protein
MEVVRHTDQNKQRLSIELAIASLLNENNGYFYSEAYDALNRTENISRMLATLISKLYYKKVLDNRDVLDLLDNKYKEV